MASYNKVILMGNLVRDPELRQLPSGHAVCNFRIAMNRRFRTSNGEDREESCFVDVEVWGRQAENCDRFLSKGRQALVEGRLRQDQWQDKDTGQSRSRLLVTANTVQFLNSSGGGAPNEGERSYERSPQQPSTNDRNANYDNQSGDQYNQGSYNNAAPQQDLPSPPPAFESSSDATLDDDIPF